MVTLEALLSDHGKLKEAGTGMVWDRRELSLRVLSRFP